jgi:hypothetical protein
MVTKRGLFSRFGGRQPGAPAPPPPPEPAPPPPPPPPQEIDEDLQELLDELAADVDEIADALEHLNNMNLAQLQEYAGRVATILIDHYEKTKAQLPDGLEDALKENILNNVARYAENPELMTMAERERLRRVAGILVAAIEDHMAFLQQPQAGGGKKRCRKCGLLKA